MTPKNTSSKNATKKKKSSSKKGNLLSYFQRKNNKKSSSSGDVDAKTTQNVENDDHHQFRKKHSGNDSSGNSNIDKKLTSPKPISLLTPNTPQNGQQEQQEQESKWPAVQLLSAAIATPSTSVKKQKKSPAASVTDLTASPIAMPSIHTTKASALSRTTGDPSNNNNKSQYVTTTSKQNHLKYCLWSDYPLKKYHLRHDSAYSHNQGASWQFYNWLLDWGERIDRLKRSQKGKSLHAQKSLTDFFSPGKKKSAISSMDIHQTEPSPEMKQPSTTKKRKRTEDEEFVPSDEETQSSGSKKKRQKIPDPTPLVVLTGPVASGKTHCVYQCASELGFSVFELNNASNLTRNYLVQIVGEITQSHSLSSKNSKTLLLIEHVDLLHPQGLDQGFFAGLNTLRESTKRPIVLTCNEPHFISQLQDFYAEEELIRFETLQPMSGNNAHSAVSHLRKFTKDVCHREGIHFTDDMDQLCHLMEGDTRKLLLFLQFWLQNDGQKHSNLGRSKRSKTKSSLSSILSTTASESNVETAKNCRHLCEKYLGVETYSDTWNQLLHQKSDSKKFSPLRNDLLNSSHLIPIHQTIVAHLREDTSNMECIASGMDFISELDLMQASREKQQLHTDLDVDMSGAEGTLQYLGLRNLLLKQQEPERIYDEKDSSMKYSVLGGLGSKDILHLDQLCVADHIRERVSVAHRSKIQSLVSKCIPLDVPPELEEIQGVVRICEEQEMLRRKSGRRFHHHLSTQFNATEIRYLNRVVNDFSVPDDEMVDEP